MTDRGKVIRGLEIHLKPNPRCVGCPYPNDGLCGDQLYRDALSLLKSQEPLAVRETELNKCVCGNEINRYWHPEFCGFCGKKLEWF